MKKILFICHGNICRSPMAESVMSYLVQQNGLEGSILVNSAAAHTDEIGNPPHYGTRQKLARERIPLVPHRATLLTRRDGEEYDLLLCMDEYNVRDVKRIVGKENEHKVKLLLSYTPHARAIADPWYTGNFDETFDDVMAGCTGLLEQLKNG